MPIAAQRSIPDRQNDPEMIELLATASTFYAYGKVASAIQVFLTVGLSVVLAILTGIFPECKLWATFVAITMTWLDVLCIDRLVIHFRKRGALAQEEFDTDVFQLQWNELRVGKHLEPEDIHQAGQKFIRQVGKKKLENWYPDEVAGLPIEFARLICQRACFYWDNAQRKRYGDALVIIAAIVIVLMIILSLCKTQSVADFILADYAPLAPAIIWLFREARRQKEAAEGLEKGRAFLNGVWEKAVAGNWGDDELNHWGRQIQDALYDSRGRNPFIFNWVYRLLRSGQEESMKIAAGRLAAQVKTKKT
jgi:hypothetical membrane protein